MGFLFRDPTNQSCLKSFLKRWVEEHLSLRRVMFSLQQVEQIGVESGDKYGSFNTIAL